MTKPIISTSLDEFTRERNAALSSRDEGAIRAYCAKYGIETPADASIFGAGIRKACAILGL